jgi:hypothetical protein
MHWAVPILFTMCNMSIPSNLFIDQIKLAHFLDCCFDCAPSIQIVSHCLPLSD